MCLYTHLHTHTHTLALKRSRTCSRAFGDIAMTAIPIQSSTLLNFRQIYNPHPTTKTPNHPNAHAHDAFGSRQIEPMRVPLTAYHTPFDFFDK